MYQMDNQREDYMHCSDNYYMIVTHSEKAHGWGLNIRPLKLGNIILENPFLKPSEFELPGKKIHIHTYPNYIIKICLFLLYEKNYYNVKCKNKKFILCMYVCTVSNFRR